MAFAGARRYMSSSNQTAKVDRIWQLSADALPGVTLVATIFGGASLIAHQTQAHMDTKLESLKSNLDSKLNASLSNMDTKLEANLTNTITKLDANLTNTNTKLDQTAKRMEAYVEKAAALQAATYMNSIISGGVHNDAFAARRPASKPSSEGEDHSSGNNS